MRVLRRRERIVRIAAGTLLGLCTIGLLSAQEISPSLYSEMQWRMIGPFRAGKVNAVAGVPGNPGVYYFGADGGGVWKTTDGGTVWKPIFDKEPIASIGALALASSNPKIIYVRTGSMWGWRTRGTSGESWSIHGIRTWYWWRRWGTVPVRTKSEEFFARRMA